MCLSHTYIWTPTLPTQTHILVISYDIPSLHYLHTLTNLSDVKNYTFIHLNNSDYFKSCALTHSLFFFQTERELFTSNRIWINPINPFKVPWDKPIKYPQRWLTGQSKLAFILAAVFLFKRHQMANQIAGPICEAQFVWDKKKVANRVRVRERERERESERGGRGCAAVM